ncbi:MAG: hypothetical protein BJBARM5_0177 [Candidatus Parvarchaeum acidophilus ARMAN-5]|uniref:Major facilitator superfamily (MFS) profile domain-containing protein n=1 Tax=Candidatus Parvarchaeum acidophilus ARMAN-5 TaxID=662762 RepID=D6GUN3_PARA5|nr:MAG: hypothetical protein BJBARM5_0177 [Candidatus Parvarchaeum acidophilus ARMAN-5]
MVKSKNNVELKEKVILTILVVGILMASIDSTIVLLAFPAMTQALHSDLSTIIWVILVYLLVTAVASTQFGRIGDIFGRSRIFNSWNSNVHNFFLYVWYSTYSYNTYNF